MNNEQPMIFSRRQNRPRSNALTYEELAELDALYPLKTPPSVDRRKKPLPTIEIPPAKNTI